MMNTKKVGKLAIPALVLSFVIAAGTIFTISCSKSNVIGAEYETVVTAKNQSTTADKPSDDNIYVIVEEMPVFDNDETKEFVKFRQYLAKNLRYPEEAAKKGIEGRVYVSFVVDTEGNVTKVKVERGVEPALDNEAIRVIQSSPQWQPGKQRGKNVNVAFTFPIVFALQ
jgi:protein TonB